MVDNLMDARINFGGLVKLVPKVCLGRLGWHINKKGDLKLRILRQEISTQCEILAFQQGWDLEQQHHNDSINMILQQKSRQMGNNLAEQQVNNNNKAKAK